MLSLRKPSVSRKLPSFEQRGQRLQLHTSTHMLIFCITAIIYDIINAVYAFIKDIYITTVSTILIKYAKDTF